MGKYSIFATKQDYKEAYEELSLLEKIIEVPLDWKKIKRVNLDEIKTLIAIIRRKHDDKIMKYASCKYFREDLAIYEPQLETKLDWDTINKMGFDELSQYRKHIMSIIDEAREKRLQKPVTITKDRTIDVDNIRLKCVIIHNGERYETYFQYIISSNSAHHSDIPFEQKMETIGIDMDLIRDDIESRKLSIN